MQRDHLLVAFESSLSPLAAELLWTCQSRGVRNGRRRSNRSKSRLPESLFDHRGMACQDVFQRFAQIAQQMETIRDLHGLWRNLAGSFGVGRICPVFCTTNGLNLFLPRRFHAAAGVNWDTEERSALRIAVMALRPALVS